MVVEAPRRISTADRMSAFPGGQLVDEPVDEAALAGVVEVLLEDLLGAEDGEVGHFGAELVEGALLLALDLGPCLLLQVLDLRLGPLDLLGAQAVRRLACLAQDALRLLVRLAARPF